MGWLRFPSIVPPSGGAFLIKLGIVMKNKNEDIRDYLDMKVDSNSENWLDVGLVGVAFMVALAASWVVVIMLGEYMS
jgi:hypothetical protein